MSASSNWQNIAERLAESGWSWRHVTLTNRATPDLQSAATDAEAARALVPYWHYVKDILIPQIQAAQKKASEVK